MTMMKMMEKVTQENPFRQVTMRSTTACLTSTSEALPRSDPRRHLPQLRRRLWSPTRHLAAVVIRVTATTRAVTRTTCMPEGVGPKVTTTRWTLILQPPRADLRRTKAVDRTPTVVVEA